MHNKTKQITHLCTYCNKEFARERTLESHACEPRRRIRAKNEKDTIIGYETFQRFYRYTQGSSRKQKTFEDFISSPYYLAFIRFGQYCIRTNVISSTRFADFLIKNNIHLDAWNTDASYTKFLIYFIPIEPVNDALTRTIEYAIMWGDSKNKDYNDLFRVCSLNSLCHAINTGQISPWVIYLSDSGQSFISMLEHYQHEAIWDMIDVGIWERKFKDNKEDVDFAKNILSIGGW